VVFCRKNINQASTTLFQFYTTGENCALANYKLWTKFSYNTGQIVGKDHFCTGFVIDTTPRTDRMGDVFLKVGTVFNSTQLNAMADAIKASRQSDAHVPVSTN